MIVLLTLLACNPDAGRVMISGRVFDGPDDGDAALSGATIASRDVNGNAVDETTADSDGAFEVGVEPSQAFHIVISADGTLATSFTGIAASDNLEVEDHLLWARDTQDAADLREEFVGCAPEGGGLIEGLVRLYLPVEESSEELPIVTTATVRVEDGNGEIHDACYLDDQGISDPSAEYTGQTGRFALTGIPAGRVTIEVDYAPSEQVASSTISIGYLPEDGTIPMYPAWATLP